MTLRNPRNTTKEFMRKAASLGFPGLRLHDLQCAHETLLLDAGVPVHVVAARVDTILPCFCGLMPSGPGKRISLPRTQLPSCRGELWGTAGEQIR